MPPRMTLFFFFFFFLLSRISCWQFFFFLGGGVPFFFFVCCSKERMVRTFGACLELRTPGIASPRLECKPVNTVWRVRLVSSILFSQLVAYLVFGISELGFIRVVHLLTVVVLTSCFFSIDSQFRVVTSIAPFRNRNAI